MNKQTSFWTSTRRSLSAAWTIARRELYAYLVSPIAYLVAAAFAILSGIFFVGGISQWRSASLQPVHGSLSIVLIFIAPILTMRLLSREQDQGTIELLLTAPVRSGEIVVGKFLASLLFYLAMIGITLLYVPILIAFGEPDLQALIAGFLGVTLLGAAMLALGVFMSALTRSQVIAAVLGVGASVGLWLLDLLSTLFRGTAREVLAYLTPSGHFYPFVDGVIDTRDMIYYLSFVALALFLATQILKIRQWGLKSAAYPIGDRLRGTRMLILTLAVTGIVILSNIMSSRYYRRFDMTEFKQHTLSEQSLQIVQSLDQPIRVIGFYPQGRDQEAFETWLEEYQALTEQIDYQAIDPILEPGQAQQYNWSYYGGGLIVERGERAQPVYAADEQDITSALLRVSSDTEPVIYVLSGHNERDIDDWETTGYSQIAAHLQDNNYRVQPLNLATTETVPTDAAMVLIAGPETTMLDEEIERLTAYLGQGGKALIMLDPGSKSNINTALTTWQVRFDRSLVIDDANALGNDPMTPVIDRYSFSQVTKNLPMIALPLARPIVQENIVPGMTFVPLAETSMRSWAKTDLDKLAEGGTIEYEQENDLRGPLTVVASVESPAQTAIYGETTRLVLIGDADLVANDVLTQIPYGQSLVLNAVHWLAEQEEMIAIGPKSNVQRSIHLTTVEQSAVCGGATILIPGVILAAGIIMWMKRR